MKSKFKLTAILTGLLLPAFIITCLVSYMVAHDSLSDQISESALPLTSDNIYSEIQQDLLRPIFISSLMAQDTFLRDWVLAGEQDPSAIIRYLKEIQTRYNARTTFFVSEKSRKYYHFSSVLKNVSESDPQDSWYFRVQQMADDYEINVDIDTADRQSLTIFINYRVYDYAENYIGAAGIGLGMNNVRTLLDSYQQRYNRRVYFVDRKGKIMLRSSMISMPEDIREIPGLENHALRILTSPSTSLSFKRGGKTVYLNSRIVPEFKWLLIVEQTESLAENRIFNTLLINLAISLVITLIILYLVCMAIGRYQQHLEKMATIDKLTGLINRHIFESLADQALAYAQRNSNLISLIMLDIDRFKEINDTHGHTTGDIVLRKLAEITREQVRKSDIVCRWGGEEFIILLPDCSLKQAEQSAEKIRNAIASLRMTTHKGEPIHSVTASLGVTEMHPGETQSSLISRADDALYRAKANGRNRTEIAC